ncbi:hypothetical protein COCON_G00226330 [Conger conger]|uniref:Uncharacterized protein n=1 Tax=Conger conger TaxID=82655 RepID=A0A9Q1HNW2_CONCO|nr:hypothetical protein COCON_G00226330 [Conger conger]
MRYTAYCVLFEGVPPQAWRAARRRKAPFRLCLLRGTVRLFSFFILRRMEAAGLAGAGAHSEESLYEDLAESREDGRSAVRGRALRSADVRSRNLEGGRAERWEPAINFAVCRQVVHSLLDWARRAQRRARKAHRLNSSYPVRAERRVEGTQKEVAPSGVYTFLSLFGSCTRLPFRACGSKLNALVHRGQVAGGGASCE